MNPDPNQQAQYAPTGTYPGAYPVYPTPPS
jgi:hypothetical protein